MERNRDQDRILRKFWAMFIGSTVEKDGNVPGFRDAWIRLTPAAQHEAERFAHWTAVKIERDRRDEDECITAGVAALEREIASLPEAGMTRPSHGEYGRFRIGLIERIHDDRLSPIAVAEILEAAADRFPEIEYHECVRYREMGETWEPYDRNAAARLKAEKLRSLGLHPGLSANDAVARA